METCKCPRCKKVTCKHYQKLKKDKKFSRDLTPSSPARASTESLNEDADTSGKRSSVQFKDPDFEDLATKAHQAQLESAYEEANIYEEPEPEPPTQYVPPIQYEEPPTQYEPQEMEETPVVPMAPVARRGISPTCAKYELPPMVVMPPPPARSGVAAATSVENASCAPAINITPAGSQGSFGIRLPYDSDYDITVKVSLDEKIMGCPEQCYEDDSEQPQPTTKIKMKFETVKDYNKVQNTSDCSTQNTVNKKDSSYCCTKSISDQSSYYSANMSYHSCSLSCRSSVHLFENKPHPEIETQRTGGHLAAGCDFCKNEKPIKETSQAADDTSAVTSLYRCRCMSQSSESNCICELNKTQKTPPSKSKIPIRKNEKCCSCKSDVSKSIVEDRSVDTTAVRTPTESVAISKGKDQEEPSLIKKVNINLSEKIKEMEEGIKIAEKKDSETSVKFEKRSEDSSSGLSDVFDPDRQIILPEVRVNIGPEKIKSIHIDVTPIKLDRSSSGIITIPVQLRFKHPPTPPEAKSDFSLKYDDKVIKAYFKTQKLQYEECMDCGENIQESVEKPTNSDMDIILPTSCSKECQFIREVTETPPLKKKRKLSKKSQVDYNNIPWCHRSTYIEPYLKIDKCPTQETVEIQTDLSLGEKILSESLNSFCNSKKCPKAKKSSKTQRTHSSLQIPWENYALPCPVAEMFQPVDHPGVRREIFPQPEEIIVEVTPKKKCSIFPICGKPTPTTCVRPAAADQYKVLVRPQPLTLPTAGTSSTEPQPGTSGIKPETFVTQRKSGLSITTHDDIERHLPFGLKPTTTQLRARMLLHHPELRKKKAKKENEEEESYENMLAPEPRPRFYRPPRTFKKVLGGASSAGPQQNSLTTSRPQSEPKHSDLGPERPRSSGSKITRDRTSSNQSKTSVHGKRVGSKQSVKSHESTSSARKKSSLKQRTRDNVSELLESTSTYTPQQSSKYISTVGQKVSSDSCFSESSYKTRKTPSFNNIRDEPRSKSLPETETKKGKKGKKTKSDSTFSKCCKRKPKSAPQSSCCPDRHAAFCMDLPDKVPVPTIKKFVFLDKCPIHEPYLEKLHLENIVVPDGTMPWEKLLLPKDITIRKISDIVIEEEKPKSHKMIQINFNRPSRRVSCPTPVSKPSKPENELQHCISAPEWLCKCDPKQLCTAPKSKGLEKKSSCFSSRDKSEHLKLNELNRDIPCSTQQSETVTYYMNENMADTTESNKNLCSCGGVCPLCCQPPRKPNFPCPGFNNRKSSAFVLKPDPVMEAFKQCEAELKPVREALAQVKTDLRNLNMPELDCIFKNDDKVYETPWCKCTKDTGTFKNIYKSKTEHFYANTTTCTAIVKKKHKYWEYEDSSQSTSSERFRVIPNKRNKGIQKTGSKHRKRHSKRKNKRLQSTSSSESTSPRRNCMCQKYNHSKYSSVDSSGGSTPRHYTNKNNKQIMPSNSDCPFLEAMRSALIHSLGQDTSCTRMIKSKKIKKVKMRVKIKPKKH